jgi:hypothetical protein
MKAAPPLLMLAEGRKPRPRKAPASRPKELVLHLDVARLLRKHARPEWIWAHVPNGEKRDPRTAAKLKAMGVKAGLSDFLLVSPAGVAHFLELKREGERLSDPQEDFKLWCTTHGVPFVVAHSIGHVLVALATWRCLDDEALHPSRKNTTTDSTGA